MKKNLTVFLTAILLVFTALPALPSSAAETEAQKEHSYELPFQVWQQDEDKVSTAGDFVKSPLTVKIEDGKAFAYVTLLQSQYWQSLKVQDGKDFVDTTVVSDEKDERVVKFELKDYKTPVSVQAHIIVTGVPGLGVYDKTYDLRFVIDSSNVPTEKPETEKPETEKPETEKPETPEVSVEDGEYTIGYKVLHEEEDKESSMNRYMETPATVTVKDGKKIVSVKLTNNEQITESTVKKDGEFVDTTVVSVDEESNSRIVSFEVENLATTVDLGFTVFVAQANHTGHYKARLVFDQESLKPVVTEEEPVEEPAEEPEVTVSFTDIDNTWAKTYIEALASKGIVKGKTADTFAPNDKMTRGQFALVIARALELPKQDAEGTFSDVTKEMTTIVQEVEAASRAGIINGDNGKFNPNAEITRQQMATMIIRAIEYKDATVLENVKSDIVFADAAQINDYAKSSVALAAGLGIIDGNEVKGKKMFDPKMGATRAHAVKMVYNMLEAIK